MLAEIDASPDSREALEARHGRVWDTTELQRDFDVIGFAAPLVMERGRSRRPAKATGSGRDSELMTGCMRPIQGAPRSGIELV